MIATLSLSVLSLTSLLAASPTNLRLVDGAVMLCERNDVASEGPYDDDPVYDCAAAQLPAVVDCADALTVALGEMIGECESPSRPGLVQPATIQASLLPLPSPSDDRPVGKRYCTADRCGMERSPPLQNAPRTHGLVPGLLPVALALPAFPVERSPIPYDAAPRADAQPRGLFRPPRA